MRKPKIKTSNIIFLIVIALLIIPQTRQPIQIVLHKGLALFSPSTIDKDKREVILDYTWQLKDQDGNVYNFEDTKGKVVFLNFWATWCPPCIAEMPSIEALYSDYKDEVVFLLVSNEKIETIKAFNDKNNYSFNFYNPISNPPNSFETRSIPRTYVIDKSGKIVMDKNGAANWNSESVRDVLDKLLTSE